PSLYCCAISHLSSLSILFSNVSLRCIHFLCFLFLPYPFLPDIHSFPTRRSSDLFGRNALVGQGDHRPEDLAGERGLHHAIVFGRSEEHTSELQSRFDLVCRLLLEIKING